MQNNKLKMDFAHLLGILLFRHSNQHVVNSIADVSMNPCSCTEQIVIDRMAGDSINLPAIVNF